MKKTFLFIAMFLLSQICFSQNPLIKQWDYRYGGTDGDQFITMIKTKDNGILLGGFSYSQLSGDKTQNNWDSLCVSPFCPSDYWIVKLDSLGIKIWDKRYGGIGNDILQTIIETSDNGYLLGGYSNSPISGDKSEPNWDTISDSFDYWIVKIDSAGNKIWDKRFGGYVSDYLYSILQTKDHGYLLGGESYSGAEGDKTEANWDTTTINPSEDYWVIKTDSAGNKVWDRRYGGTQSEQLFSLIQNQNDDFILGGLSRSGKNGNITASNWDTTNQTYDYWVVKIDTSGNIKWDYRYGGNKDDVLIRLQQATNNDYFLAGYSFSGISGNKSQQNWDPGNSTSDYWIVKIDSSGSIIWDKRFGGTATDYLRSIQLTNQNQLILGGDSYSNLSGDKTENNLGASQSWIIRIDTLGNMVWDKTIQTNGTDYSTSIVQANDGCFAFANATSSGIGGEKTQLSQGSTDYWIIKYCDTTQAVVLIPNVGFYSSDTSFCDKQNIDFTDISTNNPTSWQWYFPGATPASSTTQNPAGIYYSSFGTFDVTLIAYNAAGCDTLYVPNHITEFQLPAMPVISISNDTLFSSSAYSYAWYNSNNPGVIISTNPYYVYTQIGNYFVIISDSIGCKNSSAIFAVTEINELSENLIGFNINPNPVNNFLYVNLNSLANTTKLELRLTNIMGQEIYYSKINTKQTTIDVRNIANGIYFIQLKSEQGIFQKKIIVRN